MLLASSGWRRWADLYVDFGQQLYVPWRLSEGAVLYRDLAYLHGPLSAYANSFVFRLFGVSYTTLMTLNLFVILLVTGVLYATFREASGRVAAITASALFLVVFAFGQYVGTGNYNWVSPYAHSATHGVALFAVLVHILTRPTGARWRWSAVGALAGLLLLTRAETAVAAVLALCAHGAVRSGSGKTSSWRPIAWGIGGAALPVLAAVGLFALSLPAGEAVRAAAGAWTPLFGDVASTPFFLAGAGLDDPALGLELTVVSALSDALLIGGVAWIAWLWRDRRTHPALLALVGGLAIVAVAVAASTAYLGAVGRSLPVLACVPVVVWGRDLRRSAGHIMDADRSGGARADLAPSADRRAAILFLWSAFGLALLAKMGLHARIHHYGFYLALPAAVAVTVFVVSDLPARVAALGGSGRLLRVAMILLVAILGVRFAVESRDYYVMKTLSVGAGGNRIMTYPAEQDTRAAPFEAALAFLENLPRSATIQVLPEGVMLNYLARRVAPSVYTNFMVTEVVAFGEDVMLEDLSRAGPDYIVLMHKDTSEFGFPLFGSDERYGRRVLAWVRANYDRVLLAGAEPLRSPAFGIEILARRTPESARAGGG